MPDLCTLGDVKTWLNIADANSDVLIARLISSTSQDFLNEIRRTDLLPAADWTDNLFGSRDYWWMHGGFGQYSTDYWLVWQQNRKQEIYLRHYPINTVASVTLDGTALALVTDATDLDQTGYWFDSSRIGEDRQKIELIGFPFFYPGCGQRMVIAYNAGYANSAVTDELASIPGATPYTLAVAGAANFASNTGVKYSVSGIALVKVSGVPTVGQYAVDSSGNYTFAAADAGVTVKISYTTMGVPSKIREAIIEWVAMKRGTSQLQSVNQASGGFKIGDYEQSQAVGPITLDYLSAEIPESVQRAIDQYRRPMSF